MLGNIDVSLSGVTIKRIEKEYNEYVEANNDQIQDKFKALAEKVST